MESSIKYIVDIFPNILAVLLIVFIGVILNICISSILKTFANRQYISTAAFQIVKRSTRLILSTFVFLLLLQQFGVKVSSIITSLLAMAALVAIGFIAIWSVLSNFLCSFLLMVFSPFQIGDEIEVCEVIGGGGLRGQVVDFNIMYTSIVELNETQDANNPLIRIPNNIFFQKAIKRWKGQERKRIEKHLVQKSIME